MTASLCPLSITFMISGQTWKGELFKSNADLRVWVVKHINATCIPCVLPFCLILVLTHRNKKRTVGVINGFLCCFSLKKDKSGADRGTQPAASFQNKYLMSHSAGLTPQTLLSVSTCHYVKTWNGKYTLKITQQIRQQLRCCLTLITASRKVKHHSRLLTCDSK